VKLEDFDYLLPEDLIAAVPPERREASRMLCVDRTAETIEDSFFSTFPASLREGDVLVLNNTKVFPARLNARSETGANVEMLLQEEIEPNVWTALAKPARRLQPGKVLDLGSGITCEVIERNEGSIRISFDESVDVWNALEHIGSTPLPHYIERPEGEDASDRDRYQTIFAKERGAIAAPTAGLHFTDEILRSIGDSGVKVVEITLHVGYGTFEPVRVDDLTKHKVLPERYEVSEETAAALNESHKRGGRVVAVGTTTTRVLETIVNENGEFTAGKGRTSLTIIPGYSFKTVDAMLTNFHLPKSSLLILVSTFAGHELIMNAYRHAVRSGYRFYSYGDCMFIE
jgi:S-adenosylmethionine:tRNA ribosyltransferase-isomerase